MGILGITPSSGSSLCVWMDNPNFVASTDECTTIDRKISEKCRSILKKGMKKLNGVYGQIAVIDAETGHLKAWVAMERKDNELTDAKLLKKSCTPYLNRPIVAATMLAKAGISLEDSVDTGIGIYQADDSLTICDANWRCGGYGVTSYRKALENKSNIAIYKAIYAAKQDDTYQEMERMKKETNAMEIAASINSLYHKDRMLIPAVEGDSVESFPMAGFTDDKRRNVRDILVGANKEGTQSAFAPKGTTLAGLYSVNTLSPQLGNSEEKINELSFAGCFPADNPRYAIGLSLDKPYGYPQSDKHLSKMVNDLIKWLIKN